MARRFTTNVWTTDEAGNATFHEVGAVVPDGLPVGDHCWTDVDESYLAYTGDPDGDDPVFAGRPDPDEVAGDPDDGPIPRPPVSGPGASRHLWRLYYAQETGERAPESWTRDDLINALTPT